MARFQSDRKKLPTWDGRRIENASEGITLQIEKKGETTARKLSAYIYLIMDAQLNIKDGAFVSVLYYCIVRSSNWSRENAFSLEFA